MYEDRTYPATMADAHGEWHRNTGVPVGQPGCPQDACHPDDEWDDEAPAETSTSPEHTLSPLEPRPASAPGALDGYEMRCTCGFAARSSLEGLARSDAYAHVRWAQAQA